MWIHVRVLSRIIIRVIVEDNIIRLFYVIPDMVTFYPVLSIPILYRIFLDPGRLIVLHKLVMDTALTSTALPRSISTPAPEPFVADVLKHRRPRDFSGPYPLMTFVSLCHGYASSKGKIIVIVYHVLNCNRVIDLFISKECRCFYSADPVRKHNAVVIFRDVRRWLAAVDRIADIHDTACTFHFHSQASVVIAARR